MHADTVLESLRVDHSVRPVVAWSMARSLVKDVVSLSHLFRLMELLVGSSFYFTVSSVDFETCNFLKIMPAIGKCRVIVSECYVVWFLTRWGVKRGLIVFHVSVLDLLSGTRDWTVPCVLGAWLRPSESGRTWPVLALIERVQSTAHELIECLVCALVLGINKDAIFDLRDPCMHRCVEDMLSFGRLSWEFQTVADLTLQAALLCL